MNLKKIAICALVLFTGLTFTNQTHAASVDSEEQKFVDLLNDYRKSLGRTELKLTNPLIDGSEYFADDFAGHPDDANANIHIDSQGRAPEQRGQKYGFYFLAENIGWGYETAEEMFNAWKASEGHRENMANKSARTIGIARVHKEGATKDGNLTEWFWIADFSDEGVERLIGNDLKDSEMYSSSYKKMSLTVKKRDKKTKKYKKTKWAEVKIYDRTNGRLIDHDITDKNGKCSVYILGSGKKVKLKIASFKGQKNVVFVVKNKKGKVKNVDMTKNLNYSVKIP